MLEIFPDLGPGALIGLVGGAISFLWAAYTHVRKARVDESALILDKWKELVDHHQIDMARLKDDFEHYRHCAQEELNSLRVEAQRLRERVQILEREIYQHRNREAELLSLIEGLRRQIATTSQTVPVYLDDSIQQKHRSPAKNSWK